MTLHDTIRDRLGREYIRHEEIARLLALAFDSGKNVLLWGLGGHGKSEMVAAALACVATDAEIFVQSFGEGMDEATLWGGLDFAALERDKVLIYYPENSFLAKKFAVFEEMFDAPASVLLALKDTLTAKVLRKGSQRFAMKTEVIIAITNKDPDEVSDLGPAAAALVERFPLQLKVDWPSYTSADYLELFRKVAPRLPGADLNGSIAVLAEVMAKASEDGEVISPRTAVHALGIIKTAAALRGSKLVERSDMLDLRFLPGLEEFSANLKAELEAAYQRAAAEEALVASENNFHQIMGTAGEQSPLKLMQAHKRLAELGDKVAQLAVTDNLTERRNKLREAIQVKAAELLTQAVANTRI